MILLSHFCLSLELTAERNVVKDPKRSNESANFYPKKKIFFSFKTNRF